MVGSEPAEACLDFAPDGPRPKVLKRTLLAVRQCSTLGEDVYVISTPFDSLANDLFSAPPSIERGRVDPVHTLVNGSIHCAYGRLLILPSPVHMPACCGTDRCGSDPDALDFQPALSQRHPINFLHLGAP